MALEYHLEIQFRSSKERPMIHYTDLGKAQKAKQDIMANGYEADTDGDGPIVSRGWPASEIVCVTISQHEHDG